MKMNYFSAKRLNVRSQRPFFLSFKPNNLIPQKLFLNSEPYLVCNKNTERKALTFASQPLDANCNEWLRTMSIDLLCMSRPGEKKGTVEFLCTWANSRAYTYIYKADP